ncbi:hypothetical protein DFH28DRAFT_1132658 [Melampsora americana]|nr:hypothetical protein DFH28DRAFT_1132658 [Melampsora americana]
MSTVFDPDGPGVNKQMMLDWMHINHPKTPVNPKLDKSGVAALIRDMQPAYFSDTKDDRPSNSIDVNANQTPSTAKNLGTLQSPSNPPPGSTHPPYQLMISPFQRLPPVSDQCSSKRKKETEDQITSPKVQAHPKKRTLSDRIDIHTGTSKSKSLKKKTLLDPSNPGKPTNRKVTQSKTKDPSATTSTSETSDPLAVISVKKEFDPAMALLGLSKASFSVEEEKQSPESTNLPSETNAKEVQDLIDFSDTHCLDMGNLVIGKDIQSISFFPCTNGPKKSGIDIFQEERKREERICALEDSLSQIVDKVGCFELKAVFLDYAICSSRASIKNIENKVSNLAIFEEKVNRLESTMSKLVEDLNRAKHEIETHEMILEGIMKGQLDEDDETSEDD